MKMVDQIQKYLEKSIENNIFPGCCIFVKYHGKTDYYCLGNQQLFPYEKRNSKETLYDIASLSKVVVTTTLILMLIQEEKITLDTKIANILEDFRYPQVTLQDLLTHTSGLPADYMRDKGITSQKLMEDVYAMDLEYQTGTQVVYSDIGYILLGEVIEKVTKKSLDKVAKEKIFRPLHMDTASYNPTHKEQCAPTEYITSKHLLKQGIVHDEKCEILNGVAGHAGVFMSIYDLEKYTEMLLNGKILSPYSISLLSKKLTPEGCINRGIGYLIKDDQSPFPCLCSKKSILHTGFTGTSLFVDFENELAIGVLSNRVHPSRQNNQIISWRKEFHELVFNEYVLKKERY